MEKKVLTIKVSREFLHRLRVNVPHGKVGSFIEEEVNKELDKEIRKTANLAKAYQDCYKNNE